MISLPTIEQGVRLWGYLLAVWLFVLFATLIYGAVCGPHCTEFAGGNAYCVLVNNGTPVGAITAVLGLVWSWFFQLAQKKRELDQKDDELALRRTELEWKRGGKRK